MGGCMSRKTGGFDPQKDLKDLTGKVAIVTGGNTGIGYHTVKFLARKGAKVYLGARNEAKAKEAIIQLEREGLGPGQVIWLHVDLADPRWAKMAAEDFLQRESRLDILINNAAQLTGAYEETRDGISSVVVTNYFSPFVFTRMLLPLLMKTSKEPKSDVRIVSLGSIAHTQKHAMNPDLKFEEIQDFNQEFASDFYPDWARYSMTKLTAILFARELQKRLDEWEIPIISIPIHPGEVNTFADRLPWPILANIVMEVFFMRPEAGSYTSCFAAASPLIEEFPEKYRYTYLEPVGVVGKLSENAKSIDLASQLWETTETILKDLNIDSPAIDP
ncbi:NAD-P-binding protein [Pholiota molesta]|nr:NAD-P-binding protein [Pholiota molesta]